MKPLAWSHSSLSGFDTCPRQYEELKVLRNFKDSQNPASLWGNEFHEAAEKFLKLAASSMPLAVASLPANMVQYEPYLQKFLARPGILLAEQEYGLDARLRPCAFDGPEVWMRGIIDVLTMDGAVAYVDDHKGLALDTELPTPEGFTTMGEVKVGDTVFGSDGKPCRVKIKSGIHHRPCFRVTFSDKSFVVCDNVHLWKLLDGSVVPVTSLKYRDQIQLPTPISLRKARLPIDPYVLGLWLGDGKHTSGEITKPDKFIWEEIQRRGYEVNMDTKMQPGKCMTRTVKGIRGHLRSLDMLGNKHIPMQYLRASYAQRLDLLRGLMDSDGSANKLRKQCVFSACDGRLAGQVKSLLCSLGQRPTMNEHGAYGFGVHTRVWQVTFKPQGINPFILPRKANKVAPDWGNGDSWCRRILSVEPIPSIPTQCIGVDSSDNTYLCTRDFIVTHNTGKNRKKDMQQLIIFSLLTFYHHPQINTCHTAFHWLQLGAVDTETFYRHQIPELWNTLVPKLQKYKAAFDMGIFPPRPSGLCKKHCVVDTCEYFGGGRR